MLVYSISPPTEIPFVGTGSGAGTRVLATLGSVTLEPWLLSVLASVGESVRVCVGVCLAASVCICLCVRVCGYTCAFHQQRLL